MTELSIRQKTYAKNREREITYSNEYYAEHKDEILKKKSAYAAKFRAENLELCRERDREKRKVFVAAHKEKVDAYNNTHNICECGGKFFTKNKALHNRGKKHIKFTELKTNP